MPGDLSPGDVVWATFDGPVGREQGGRRPAVVVAGSRFLAVADRLAVIVPVTSRFRGWPQQIPLLGSELGRDCWAMPEQVRTIARERIVGRAGRVTPDTLSEIRYWLAEFLDLN